MYISLPARRSNTFIFIQNVSPHLADLHLKTTILTTFIDKRLERPAVADRIKYNTTTRKRMKLLSRRTGAEQTQAKAVFLIVLVPQNAVSRDRSSNNFQYSDICAFRNFIDEVVMNGYMSIKTYIKTIFSFFAKFRLSRNVFFYPTLHYRALFALHHGLMSY